MNQKLWEHSVPLVFTKAFQGWIHYNNRVWKHQPRGQNLESWSQLLQGPQACYSGAVATSREGRCGSQTAWLCPLGAGHGGSLWACPIFEALNHTKACDTRFCAQRRACWTVSPILRPPEPLNKLLSGSQSRKQEPPSTPPPSPSHEYMLTIPILGLKERKWGADWIWGGAESPPSTPCTITA